MIQQGIIQKVYLLTISPTHLFVHKNIKFRQYFTQNMQKFVAYAKKI